MDEKGTVRALLGVQADNGAPGFLLADAQGRPRVAVHVSADGNPAVDLLDPGGAPRLHMGLDAAGAPAITRSSGPPRTPRRRW